jgi:hypothetical protein
MRELRLDYVFGVILFFSTIANDLLNDSLTYLEQATNQLVEMTKELQNEQMQ